jgi:hypothetical protein
MNAVDIAWGTFHFTLSEAALGLLLWAAAQAWRARASTRGSHTLGESMLRPELPPAQPQPRLLDQTSAPKKARKNRERKPQKNS